MRKLERESQFNPDADKERKIVVAAETLERKKAELTLKQLATGLLALAKHEGGSSPVTQETVKKIY